jgi:hypothetical protein
MLFDLFKFLFGLVKFSSAKQAECAMNHRRIDLGADSHMMTEGKDCLRNELNEI